MLNIKNSPSQILNHISNNIEYYKDFTFIIMGRSGATGKTWLWNGLNNIGLKAVEISEEILPLVEYIDDENHYSCNTLNKIVLLVLNKPLKEK